MHRIYLDTNVLTSLRTQPQYENLLETLIQLKESCQFYYSYAHLDDLSRDETDQKNLDLEFMERLVDDQLLAVNLFTKSCSLLLATPEEAFTARADESNAPSEEPNLEAIRSLRKLDAMQEFGVLFDTVEQLSEVLGQSDDRVTVTGLSRGLPIELREKFERLGYRDGVYERNEWVEVCNRLIAMVQADKDVYRQIRRMADSTIEAKRHNATIQDENYDANLGNTSIGHDFSTVLSQLINPLQQFAAFDNFFIEYTMAYSMLNMLAMDTEKNRTARFNSVLTDAQHSYYGIAMDYVVSDDRGFVSKTKALYNRYGVPATVLTLDEFSDSLFKLRENQIQATEFFRLLRFDLTSSMTVETVRSVHNHKYEPIRLTQHRYFAFFDRVAYETNGRQSVITLSRKRSSAFDFLSYREVESATSRVSKTFGADSNILTQLSESEKSELKSGSWRGREWRIEGAIIQLFVDREQNELILQINLLDVD